MSKSIATTTAGVRGSFWNPEKLPPDTQFQPALVPTADGAMCQGILAHTGSESIAVMGMHPREYQPCNYLVPEFLQGGAAFWMQAPRSIGNDIRLEHETALFDVAAGVTHLRQLGYEKIILTGMSGGASLFSFYLEQVNLAPKDRLARSPAGRPTRFDTHELPGADGAIFISPHPGQGILLMNSLDPSVVDEDDPTRTDETLDPFSAANGFRMPPETSSYDETFVARYRQGQRKRVERLDAWAREASRKRIDARKRAKETRDFLDLRDGAHTPIRTIWRTDADLRCFDLSLEPTDRAYGSLWGANPMVANYGSVGFGRTVTPESWLSTWSGLSSNAAMARTAAGVTQPSLVIRFSGDNSVFPSDTQAIFDALASTDKRYEVIPGNHHGRPIREGDPDGQALAGELLRSWVTARFR